MKISLNDPGPGSPASEPPPKRQRSVFGKMFHGVGWLLAGPIDWADTRRIRRSWSLIGDLASDLRAGPVQDKRFKTEEQGAFDLRASAFSYGLTVQEFERRLLARRLQTARIAYTTFALALLFLGAWVWHALTSPLTATRVTSAMYFLPFCALFFLIAAYNALLNYQIRSRRLASWRDYMATADWFWPS